MTLSKRASWFLIAVGVWTWAIWPLQVGLCTRLLGTQAPLSHASRTVPAHGIGAHPASLPRSP
ncbi:hypothetical protein E0F15_00020 [Frankia sp. B2]|nr:hypothetical protein E0F15_00020 [Frankia sp. B2]